jgi:hypothetical protein
VIHHEIRGPLPKPRSAECASSQKVAYRFACYGARPAAPCLRSGLATLGLTIYDQRNTQIYHRMMLRGVLLERARGSRRVMEPD